MKEFPFRKAYLPWFFLFFSIFTSALKTGPEIVSFNIANLIRIGVVCLICVFSIIIILMNRNGIVYVFSGTFGWFIVFGICALISSAYASQGFYAIWKSIELTVDILAVAAITCLIPLEKSLRDFYEFACICFGFLVLSFIIGAILFPGTAFTQSRGLLDIKICGVIPPVNPNGVAFISAVVSLKSIINFLGKGSTNKIRSLIIFFCSFVILVLAQSRTSLVGLFVALVAYLFFDKQNGKLIFLIILIIISLTLNATVVGYLQRGQSTELAMSLSGRTYAWEAAWSYFKQSPFLGHGYASAGRFDVLKAGEMSTLHGALFDVLVGVGLMGLVPWLMGIVYSIVRLLLPRGISLSELSVASRSFRAELLAMLTLILVRTTTSSGLAMHDHTLMLFLIVSAFATFPTAMLQPHEQMEDAT